MKYLAITLASAALASAQTPSIAIHPGGPPAAVPAAGSASPGVAANNLAAPVLGYLPTAGSLGLRLIGGSATVPRLGVTLAVPSSTQRFFLPPREHYLLLEAKSGDPVAVWLPSSSAAPTSLPGVPAHPSAVAFSARGDAALLYFNSADRIQILKGLPAEPSVLTAPGLARWGDPVAFAVSDDGSSAVAILADGRAVLSAQAADWRPLPAADNARAILFVPRSQNLVIADIVQKNVTLITDPGGASESSRVLAQNVAADRLAFNREGSTLLAQTRGQVWTIDLKIGAAPVLTVSSSIDSLIPLRDGHSFLVASPLGLLHIPPVEGADPPAPRLVPVSR